MTSGNLRRKLKAVLKNHLTEHHGALPRTALPPPKNRAQKTHTKKSARRPCKNLYFLLFSLYFLYTFIQLHTNAGDSDNDSDNENENESDNGSGSESESESENVIVIDSVEAVDSVDNVDNF